MSILLRPVALNSATCFRKVSKMQSVTWIMLFRPFSRACVAGIKVVWTRKFIFGTNG